MPSLKKGKRVLPEWYSLEHDCFSQSQPGFVPSESEQDTVQQLEVIDDGTTTAGKPWSSFVQRLNDLNASADEGTTYKLLYFIKTGEAVHNFAQAIHGNEEWFSKWSRETTDGTLIWGPDSKLTVKGEGQTILAGASLTQLVPTMLANEKGHEKEDDSPPVMQSAYTSPLRRATDTLAAILDCVDLKVKKGNMAVPCVLEDIRPPLTASTADMRSSKSEIQARHPGWRFNTSFSEVDKLSRATIPQTEEKPDDTEEEAGTKEETVSHKMKDESELKFKNRMKKVLDAIFSSDENACIGIVTHGRNINAFREILGREPCEWPHGYIIPMLVKAEGMYIVLEVEVEAENDEVSEEDDKKADDKKEKKEKKKEKKDKRWRDDVAYSGIELQV